MIQDYVATAVTAVVGAAALALQVTTPGQLPGRPVELSMYVTTYTLGTFLIATMLMLNYKASRDYPTILTAPFGVVGVVFYLLALGVQYFEYPFPGAIVGIALSVMLIGSGVALGWLWWGISDDALAYLAGELPEGIADERPR